MRRKLSNLWWSAQTISVSLRDRRRDQNSISIPYPSTVFHSNYHESTSRNFPIIHHQFSSSTDFSSKLKRRNACQPPLVRNQRKLRPLRNLEASADHNAPLRKNRETSRRSHDFRRLISGMQISSFSLFLQFQDSIHKSGTRLPDRFNRIPLDSLSILLASWSDFRSIIPSFTVVEHSRVHPNDPN